MKIKVKRISIELDHTEIQTLIDVLDYASEHNVADSVKSDQLLRILRDVISTTLLWNDVWNPDSKVVKQ
jgi:hypothetical protein